jgi:hypothetical protein
MMEAVRTSETSVYSNDTTRRYMPEDSNIQEICHFHTRQYEKFKCHRKSLLGS